MEKIVCKRRGNKVYSAGTTSGAWCGTIQKTSKGTWEFLGLDGEQLFECDSKKGCKAFAKGYILGRRQEVE